MTMETIFLIVLAAFNVWTIYFYNKLLLEVANGKEKEKKPPIDPMALVGKSLFKVSQLRKKEETEQKQTESMSVSDNDVTFDDSPKSTARISDEQLDDVFTNVRIEDIGVKYSDNKKDSDVPQAKGSSFEDIDAAVNTVKAPKATDKEKRHAGKVFHEMDGNQFYEKFMENSEECKKNIHDYVTFYLQTHKIVEISKPKKEFKVSDSIEDFNILDFYNNLIRRIMERTEENNATKDRFAHVGKIFSEMDSEKLQAEIAERSKIIKRKIDALMELHMSGI